MAVRKSPDVKGSTFPDAPQIGCAIGNTNWPPPALVGVMIRDTAGSTMLHLTPAEAVKFAQDIIDMAASVDEEVQGAERDRRLDASDEYWAMMRDEEEEHYLDEMLEANLQNRIQRWEDEQAGII
jgi:hypothetical protein